MFLSVDSMESGVFRGRMGEGDKLQVEHIHQQDVQDKIYPCLCMKFCLLKQKTLPKCAVPSIDALANLYYRRNTERLQQ